LQNLDIFEAVFSSEQRKSLTFLNITDLEEAMATSYYCLGNTVLLSVLVLVCLGQTINLEMVG
jgi:hypothetical protein